MNLVELDIYHILKDIHHNLLIESQVNLKDVNIILGRSLRNRKARDRMVGLVRRLQSVDKVLAVATHFQCVISHLDDRTLDMTVFKSHGRPDIDVQVHVPFKVGYTDHL